MRKIARIDLTGQIFGRLTVICETERPEGVKGGTYWLCECSCGKRIKVNSSNLKSKVGAIQSCGCLAKENASERRKKRNEYDLSGEYGICYASNTDDLILFDLEDYDLIKDYCWNIKISTTGRGKQYKTAHTMTYGTDKREHLSMHRYILGLNDSSIIVDHINRNSLDNRKSNLRICTTQQNNCNIESKSHEYKGITVYKRKNGSERWVAQIQANRVKYMLGSFNTKEEAALAYNEAAKKLHGEFAYLNEVHMENEINTNKGEILNGI